MAELVHLRLEHGLAELEEMERIGLFSRAEIRLKNIHIKFEFSISVLCVYICSSLFESYINKCTM